MEETGGNRQLASSKQSTFRDKVLAYANVNSKIGIVLFVLKMNVMLCDECYTRDSTTFEIKKIICLEMESH